MWLLPTEDQTPLLMQSKKLENVLVEITVSAGMQGKLEGRDGGMDQPQ